MEEIKMRTIIYGACDNEKGVVYSSINKKKVEEFIENSNSDLKLVYKWVSI